MKCIVYRTLREKERVERGDISQNELAILMGVGCGWDTEQIDRQIINFARSIPLGVATAWVHARAKGGLTEAEAIALIISKDSPAGTLATAVVEDAVLSPIMKRTATAEDRYFRDAIRWDDTVPDKCRCDMPTARIIHMNRIRQVRDTQLIKLDVELIRSLEAANIPEQQRIAHLKQQLRDIPQTFDLSGYATPETLKAAWPAQLPPRVPL